MADSIASQQSGQKCRRCWHELEAGALVCEHCHALVHSQELERIAAEAKALEAQGRLSEARELWLAALPLLPTTSSQATWIQAHAAELALDGSVVLPELQQRRGPLGPMGPLVVSLIAFTVVSWSWFGPRFGIGFSVLILIHEMGHYIDIKRRGLPADMPVFLPGLGAYVRWRALGVSAETRAAVSLAGPFAGLLSAAACALLWWLTRDPYWASLARSAAWLNVLNLIPVWALDGGQAASVLGRRERLALLIVSMAALFLVKERIFVLLAVGAAYRVFTRDVPAQPSRTTAAYFGLTLLLLALLLAVLPGRGFGMP